jgi:WD40 repeat protein
MVMKSLILILFLLQISDIVQSQVKPEIVLPYSHTKKITYTDISYDNKYYLTVSLDQTVKVWKKSGVLITTFTKHTDEIIKGIWSPIQNLILTFSDDRTAKVWNPFTGKVLQNFSKNNWKKQMPDGLLTEKKLQLFFIQLENMNVTMIILFMFGM